MIRRPKKAIDSKYQPMFWRLKKEYKNCVGSLFWLHTNGGIAWYTECGDANTPEEVTQMNDATQNDFERLRYYYWRYLTPQQRLQVLADLEILPAVADKALPQTLEQLALDMAKSARKLAPLWSAIMQHVPDADRKPNPFQHNTEDE